MNKENFLLYKQFKDPISKDDFLIAKQLYLDALEENPYAMIKHKDIYELITNIKRSPGKIGPYQDISVFEALNRIGSDLVLLSGTTKIFNGDTEINVPAKIQLRMGNTHGFDFEVHTKSKGKIYGEAFNAAESFCKSKMRDAIHKLMKNNPDKKAKHAIVFINQEVEDIIENYKNKYENADEKKDTKDSIKIHRIYCGKI